MNLTPTLAFTWATSGSPLLYRNKDSGYVYTNALPTAGCSQIGLIAVTNSGAGGYNAVIRVQWGVQVAPVIDAPNPPTVFVEDSIQQYQGLAGGANYFFYPKNNLVIMGTTATIWIPAAAHYFKVGCGGSLNPPGGDSVTIYIELAA